MHKKFLRTLTLVFMQGVLFWSLGLQESAAMDPRMQLEAEKTRYLKVLAEHDSTFSRHPKNPGPKWRREPILIADLHNSLAKDAHTNGCDTCTTAATHYLDLCNMLDPDGQYADLGPPPRPQILSISAEEARTSPQTELLRIKSKRRGLDPETFKQYVQDRRIYRSQLLILDAHNDFFSSHKDRIDEGFSFAPKRITNEPIGESDLLKWHQTEAPSSFEFPRNCKTCQKALSVILTIMKPMMPGENIQVLLSAETERLSDPSRCLNAHEKFNAYSARVNQCKHPKTGYDRKYGEAENQFVIAIATLDVKAFRVKCPSCENDVRDAIQTLKTDPEFCEKTTKQYREKEEKNLLKDQKERRNAQEAEEQKSRYRSKLHDLEQAAKEGTADAQYALGDHLSPSNSCSPSALPWFRLAADQGHKGALDRVSAFLGEEKSAEEASLRQTYASLASCRDCAPHNKKEYSTFPRYTTRTVPGQPYGSFGQIGLPTTVTDTTWVTETKETPVPSRNIPELNSILATVLKMKVDPSYNLRPNDVKTSVGCKFCDPLLNTAFLQLYKSSQSPDDIKAMSVRVYKKTFGQ